MFLSPGGDDSRKISIVYMCAFGEDEEVDVLPLVM